VAKLFYQNWDFWFKNKPSGNPGLVKFAKSGVDVMITIFLRFLPIFCEKNWRFIKKQ
jgi:hypothetical protein